MTRKYWANLALCLILGVLVIFSITRAGSALTAKGLFVSDPQPSHEAEKLLQDVALLKYQIQIDDSRDKMVVADFFIANNSEQDIKNVSVLCEFFDENGTYRDRELWKLAETIPAEHEAKISSVSKRFVNTGVRIVNCTLADLQLVKTPAFSLDRHVGGGHEEASETDSSEQSPGGH